MNTQPLSCHDDASATDTMPAFVADHAPVIRFDSLEPFLPKALGYTVHDADGPSASADHPVRLNGAARAIEYSIWWDWDIQHLYELEHIWVYLDADDQVVRVESSAHGTAAEMWQEGRQLPMEAGRVTLFSEPGKHAFAATPEALRANYAVTTLWCRDEAGKAGILKPDFLLGALDDLTIYDRHLAEKFMQSQAFKPSFRFDRSFDLRDIPVMAWPELLASIPGRVRAELQRLRGEARGVKAVFLDSGDTLIDEDSQVFVEGELVLQANPIPGGDRLVSELKKRGYLVALVADGLVKSFENVHKAMGFWDLFDARIISEEVGAYKPDALMFQSATKALGLTEQDHAGCVMVGNNLERDIAGANRLGMQSIWISWTKNYPKDPACDEEVPNYEIKLPHELLDVLETIDAEA